jgi:signal transduction histidine kinase
MALLSAVLVVTFGALVTREALADARERLREAAVVQVRQAASVYADTGAVPSEAALDSRWPPGPLADALPRTGVANYDDGEYIWASQRLPTGELVSTRLPRTPLVEQRDDLRTTVLRSAGLVIPTSWLLGWFAADLLTARLRATARRARSAGRDRESPVYVGGDDEVADLARAIDEMASALTARHATERAFSADVAHELRTPLTALVSAVELLPEGPDTARVRGQVSRLRTMVEDLLELARLEGARPPETITEVDLGAEVSDALAELPGAPRVTYVENDRAVVRAEPAAIRRIVANLVANAHRHGAEPVRVEVRGAVLTVSDSGPGFPQEILSHGPRRFHRFGTKSGSGLGLTLTLRLADHVGAAVELRNTPSASVSVSFVEVTP